MKFGVFSKPKTYPIWVRFSNGGTPPKDDKEGDIRGMAIKLMGVDGDKYLEIRVQRYTKSRSYPCDFVN